MSSISTGTTKLQNLIPVFFEELERRSPYSVRILRVLYPVEEILGLSSGDREWHSQLTVNFYETLVRELNYTAPPGQYFGVRPGDGVDFGYWYHSEGHCMIAHLKEGVAKELGGLNIEGDPKVILRYMRDLLAAELVEIKEVLNDYDE